MKLLKTTEDGIEIYIDGNGKFHAEIGNKKFHSSTLSLLISRINKVTKQAARVIFLDGYNLPGPVVLNVIQEENGRYRNIDSGELLPKYSDLYEYDEEMLKQLESLYQQHLKILEEYISIRRNLKRVRA